MASWTITTLLLVTIFSLLYNSLMGQSVEYSVSASTNLFASELMHYIVDQKSTENIVCSPLSIYTSLAYLYMGAKNHTADELRKVLKIDPKNKDFGFKYGNLMRTTFKKTKPEDNAPKLNLVNRLYVSNKIKVTPLFKQFSKTVDFSKSLSVVENINKWVEEQTEKNIKNILQPNSVDHNTNSILVNAIYFKAKWLYPFMTAYTKKRDFYISPSQKVQVDTMYTEDIFGYVELHDLNAVAVAMPYQNSDISMLVIVPNDIVGLQKLEESLKGKNLNDIAAKLHYDKVHLFIPKFRIEYDIDLNEPLKKMGISSLFEGGANLSGIFKSDLPQKISEVKQKAFVECNEEGTEAGAATYFKITNKSMPSSISISVNNPFFFAILSKTTIYFAGHVATL